MQPRLEDLEGRALLSVTEAAVLRALAAETIPATRRAAADPQALLDLSTAINDYRLSQGLPSIPLSPKLTTVADTHIADWVKHKDELQALGYNLHGWSTPVAGEPWKTFGNFVAGNYQVMWDKPKEITGYPGYGYEIGAVGVSSAQEALDLWLGDAPHRDVILNQGIWKDYEWQALGAAVGDGYAFAWFGAQLDTPQLVSPRLIAPANNSVFSTYPRTTTLTWDVVSGAESYTVEIDFFYGSWYSDDNPQAPWLVHGINATTYTFDFVGAQPGRWRVWAVDALGQPGEKSEWWYFSYTV